MQDKSELEKAVEEAVAAKTHFLLCWLQIICKLRVMLIKTERG